MYVTGLLNTQYRCCGPVQSRFCGCFLCSWWLPEPWDNEARDKTTVKRDWWNLQQTVGRLVLSEPGSYTNCTGGRLVHTRGGRGGRQRRPISVKGTGKTKTPTLMAKHSSLKRVRFLSVACHLPKRQEAVQRDVSQAVSGMRRSASTRDELTSPNILHLVRIRGAAERCPDFGCFAVSHKFYLNFV